MDLKAIGELVKRLRKERNWSQAKLAQMAKKSQQHVSFVENAKTAVSWSTLEAILAPLGQKLWVQVYDGKAPRVGIEVPAEVVEFVELFEVLDPEERDRVIRFARGQPVPPLLGQLVGDLLVTLEKEARQNGILEERRRQRAAKKKNTG